MSISTSSRPFSPPHRNHCSSGKGGTALILSQDTVNPFPAGDGHGDQHRKTRQSESGRRGFADRDRTASAARGARSSAERTWVSVISTGTLSPAARRASSRRAGTGGTGAFRKCPGIRRNLYRCPEKGSHGVSPLFLPLLNTEPGRRCPAGTAAGGPSTAPVFQDCAFLAVIPVNRWRIIHAATQHRTTGRQSYAPP